MSRQSQKPGTVEQRRKALGEAVSNQEWFSLSEVAFILDVKSVRTIREYVTRQKQKGNPDLPRLVAVKDGTMYKVSRAELINFINREYGPYGD